MFSYLCLWYKDDHQTYPSYTVLIIVAKVEIILEQRQVSTLIITNSPLLQIARLKVLQYDRLLTPYALCD